MWQCPGCGLDFKNSNQSHSCSDKPTIIDEYIAAQPEEVQPILNKIHKTMRKAAPKAHEKISWSMPTFWQSENLIHFDKPIDYDLITEITKFRVKAVAISFPV